MAPTPPPTPPTLKPGISGGWKEKGEEERCGGRGLLPTYDKEGFLGQKGKRGVCLGGAMTADLKTKINPL